MEPVRLGLIGAGAISGRHLRAMASLAEVSLTGIADPAPASVALAERLAVPHFPDAQSLLAGTPCDGVVICTPTERHAEPTLAALDRGVHVLVEKPISATVAEAERIVARSRAAGRHVLVGHQRRYYPQVARAREIVRGGELGRLVCVSGQWAVRKPADYYAPAWRKRWQAGPVLTNLIHEIDCIRHICGEIASVQASTSHAVEGWEKEDVAALILRFEGGALGSFVVTDRAVSPWSWEAALGENDSIPATGQNALRFSGTDASLDFPNPVLWRSADAAPDWTSTLTATPIPLTASDPYVAQMRHFAAAIRGEAVPRIDAADAARSLAATVAVLESARTGAPVPLAEGG